MIERRGPWIRLAFALTLGVMSTTARGESVSDEEMASARSAFDQLYRRHALLLRAFLLARVARSEVDDLDQLVWLRVWKSLPKAEPGPFRAWLFKIARNALIDQSRQKRPGLLAEGEADALIDDKPCQPDGRLIEHERKAALERCLARLKENAAAVIRGRLSGEDYEAIGKAQGIAPKQAHSIFHKAKELLKTCVKRALS
jgi:RNA polymerase sigma factor (sigma-70 family)